MKSVHYAPCQPAMAYSDKNHILHRVANDDATPEVSSSVTTDNGTSAIPVHQHKPSAITIETADVAFNIQPADNLLDALLNKGHDIEYQCRSGYCGACRTKVESGEVSYDEYPLAHINHDEILPCCCRVTEPLRLAVKLRHTDNDGQGDLFEQDD